ncbi:MAG: hypothetical protein ABI554_01015 [Flavobacterium sp.]
MKKQLLLVLLLSFFLHSCTKDENPSGIDKIAIENTDKEKNLERFSEILSKVTYNRKDVREFIKKEASKQFDKDYNVLYYLVRNSEINGESFRDILVSFSSEKAIAEIEKNVPLLNILVPNISFFDISAQNLDTNDNEIPVVLSNDTTTDLYLNGKLELKLEKGEVPNFHVFVVKENDRVDVNSIHYSTISAKSNSAKFDNTITFLSPNFDGLSSQPKKDILMTNRIVDKFSLDPLVVTSYSYFNQNVSNNGAVKAYQRDYVYFGITDKNSQGVLNQNVTDYIDYLEVNPSIYFKFNIDGRDKGNPIIENEEVTQTKRELSSEELVDRMWTKGSYEFKFEVFSENSSQSSYVIIPVKPSDICDFNISHTRKNGTVFRPSKNTYRIDPNNFTSKVFRLNDMVAFNKWDISKESLTRYVNVSEVNKSALITEKVSYTVTKVAEGKFNGSVKLGIGEKSSVELGGSGSDTETTTSLKEFTRSFNTTDDLLAGSIKIYFYNPIINNINGNSCDLFYYSSGAVKFSIIPRIQ